MDAIEFVKIVQLYTSEANKHKCSNLDYFKIFADEDAENIVKSMELWNKSYSVKTYQNIFIEQMNQVGATPKMTDPKNDIFGRSRPSVCKLLIFKDAHISCDDVNNCIECWNETWSENNGNC